jgi:hypothetical protein
VIEDMRGRISENIEDPDKKTAMLALVYQVEKDLLEVDRVVQKFYGDLGTLTDNYDASPDEFRKVNSEFEAERKVELRFQMKDLVTAEEWQAMHVQREQGGVLLL